MPTCTPTIRHESVVFENGGQKIFGILHLPEEEKRVPIVVILHGFASHKVGTNRSYVLMGEALAKEGFGVLRFDFRGAGDSEGLTNEITISGLVSDALKAFEFVTHDPRFDGERLSVFGSSLGGSIGILAASTFTKVKSLVVWAPVANGQLWYHDWLVQHPEKALLDPRTTPLSYRGVKVNPQFQAEFAHLDAAKSLRSLSNLPFLHMQSEEDPHVSLLHQKAFKEQREEAIAPTQFLSFKDKEHMLGRSPNFGRVIEESLHWFQTHG